MSGLWSLTALGLKLNARNRMAILYGYLFPLIFLLAFWAIYRNDPVPLILHLGQFLTVTILGSACFGLPTTIVSERERGVWRRYLLLPARHWVFVTSVLVTRLALLVTAVALQLALAFMFGMPMPAHPLDLLVAFMAASAAFLALGMVIAMLVDNVPAVQALGQCLFLPMLMIGGVAVRLESLPHWAQVAASFFPGRYAVEAMQSAATGAGVNGYDLLVLGLIAVAGAVAAEGLFRWDRQFHPNRAWVAVALAMWIAVGVMTQMRQTPHVAAIRDTRAAGEARDYVRPLPRPAMIAPQDGQPIMVPTWQAVTEADIAGIAFDKLPPDSGVVSPVARPDEEPDAVILPALDRIQVALATWAPGKVADPVQRARNLLTVAAVPDIMQMEQVERFVPRLVFARLQTVIPSRDLPKILYWIAMHPEGGDGTAMRQLDAFGLPQVSGPQKPVRGRVMLYAFKLLGRLTGHIVPTAMR